MKKSEFDDLFVDVKQKIGPNSESEILDTLASYAKDVEHMKLEEIIAFLLIESRKYANDLVYNMFLTTVVDKDD